MNEESQAVQVQSANNLTVSSPGDALTLILQDIDKLRDFPVETLERLYDLQERSNKEHSRLAYNAAFLAVQQDLSPIVKKLKNDQTGSMYAALEDVSRMLMPVMREHGFSHSVSAQGAAGNEGQLEFVLTLRHLDGHEATFTMPGVIDDRGMRGSPTKTALHGIGSAYKYCTRYLLVNVFGINLVDKADDDGNAGGRKSPRGNTISQDQVIELEDLITETGTNRAKALAYYKVERIGDLVTTQYTSFRGVLQQRRDNRG